MFSFHLSVNMPVAYRKIRTGRKIRRTRGVAVRVRGSRLLKRARSAVRGMKNGKDTSFWNWHMGFNSTSFTWGATPEVEAYIEPL